MPIKYVFIRVQVLRFLAAALVVAYHAQLTAISYFGGAAPYPLLEYGAYGVDLFFVISGFIIVFIGSTRETSASVFIRRRIERIVPLYWIFTLCTYGLTHIPGLARTTVSDFRHLVQSLFFVSWLNGSETYPVLNVGWTLEYEMLFYTVAALALALARRAWICAAFVMLALVLSGRGTDFFLQNPIMIEFVFGMMIGAFLYDRKAFRWLFAGSAVVLATLPFHGAAWRVWVFGIPSALLVSGSIALDLDKPYRERLFPVLGNASYSIYIVHVLVISFMCKVVVVLVPHMPLVIMIPLLTTVAVGTGYLCYRWVERSLLLVFKRRRHASPLALLPEALSHEKST